jgi:hypothetical protein
MKDIDVLNENCSAPYQNTRSKVSWGVVENRVQFQGSVEAEDWVRNFMVLPVPYRIKKVWIWVSLGMLLAWLEIRKRVLASGAKEGGAYSGGGPVCGLWSAETGYPATIFGSPRFLYKPTLKALKLFENVRFIDAPFDIVTQVPPWGERGSRVYTLDTRHVEKPDWMSWALFVTGHSLEEYRQRMV